MISDEIGTQLHDKLTRGESLTAEEHKLLEVWYDAQDIAEHFSLFHHMSVKVLIEVVKNGKISLDSDVRLPDGTTVYVVIPQKKNSATHLSSPHFVQPGLASLFQKEVIEILPDEGE